MRKKIKKIICILSAVVIAFSSFFVVSAAEEERYTSEEFFDSILYSVAVSMPIDGSDESEIFEILPKSSEIVDNTIFYTFDSSDFPKGFEITNYYTFFVLGSSAPELDDEYCLFVYLSDGLSISDDSFSSDFQYFHDYDFYVKQFPIGEEFAFSLEFFKPVEEFSIAFEFSDFETDSTLPEKPNMENRSFYSDIKTFLGSSINWVTQIFKNLTKNPPTLILVICFSVVGFAYAMLYKFIGYKR